MAVSVRDFTRDFKAVSFLFIFAFAVRITWLIATGYLVHPQIWEYEQVALNMIEGRGFTYFHLSTVYYFFVQPLYPFICAVIYFFTNHSIAAVVVFQAVVSASLCVVIFKIADLMFGRGVAVLSALAVSLHPGLILYCGKLHPFTIDTFLISLIALIFLCLKSDFSIRRQISAGIIIGICILSRSTAGLFLIFSIIWFFYKGFYPKKKILLGGAVIIAASLIVVSPWLVRGYLIHRQFVMIESTSAEVFWRGNNLNASGSAYQPGGNTVLGSSSPEFLKRLRSLDEMGQTALFRQEAFDFIKQDPARFLALFIKKLYYFWWFSPQSGMEYPGHYILFYRLVYPVMLLLAITGIICALRNNIELRNMTALVLILFISISFAQSLFYVEGRHRLAIEPLLLIFTLNGVFNIRQKIFK